MAVTRLSAATFVKRGYGQVEPQHLSAQRTGEIYAQLPANADITVLENGQFVKYDYVNGEVNFADTDNTLWLMVFNEVKLYKDREQYEDFAMLKQAYNARVYAPIGESTSTLKTILDESEDAYREGSSTGYTMDIPTYAYPEAMKTDTNMVPRCIRIHAGDIYTTNCVKETSLAVGDILKVGSDGYLSKTGTSTLALRVVKVYTLADNQPAVKLQCIAE